MPHAGTRNGNRGWVRRLWKRWTVFFVHVADAPFRYPPARATLRRAIVGRFPYAVYFGLDPVGVVIFAVLHQRRDQNVLDERRVKKSD